MPNDAAGRPPARGPETEATRGWVPETRRRRIPMQVPMTVAVSRDAPRIAAVVLNLSTGGVFIHCSGLFPVGTPLWVSVSLPAAGGQKVVTTGAWVRWVNSATDPRAPMLPPGMGLEFLGLDAETRATLEAFVAERADATSTVH